MRSKALIMESLIWLAADKLLPWVLLSSHTKKGKWICSDSAMHHGLVWGNVSSNSILSLIWVSESRMNTGSPKAKSGFGLMSLFLCSAPVHGSYCHNISSLWRWTISKPMEELRTWRWTGSRSRGRRTDYSASIVSIPCFGILFLALPPFGMLG